MPNSLAKFNHFTTGLASFGVNDIESEVLFTPNPTLAFGATGITAQVNGVFVQNDPGIGVAIDDQALLETDSQFPPPTDTSFTFNQHITAFGVFVIEGGDVAANPMTFRLTDTVTSNSVDVPLQVGPNWGFGNVFFMGIADSTPFNLVTLIETGDGDGMLYDNVVAGFVPEPNSCALMALAGVGMFRQARRRRRG
jgi:hypothetical protein